MSDAFGGEPACAAAWTDDHREPSDADLAQLIRDLADAVVICDATGGIVFWNSAATALFGWSALEVAGRRLDIIVPPRHWDRYSSAFDATMSSGVTKYADQLLKVPAIHRDGREMRIEFTVSLLRDPLLRAPVGMAAVVRAAPKPPGIG